VRAWDDVVHHRLSGRAGGVTINLADGREIKLDLHPAAIEERARAASAILPYRGAVVDQTLSGRPAARAGIQPGDSIVAVNGQPVSQRYDVLSIMDTSAGRPTKLTVARGGRLVELTMTASSERGIGLDGKVREVGRIGIRFRDPERTEPYTLVQAVGAGGEATLNSMTFIVRTVQGLLTRRVSASNVGGPILIAQQAGEFARLGFDPFLEFMALISVNLAVLNLLPVPVLDGGQLVMLLAEAVTRRPVPVGLRERLTMFGLVVVVLLMVLAFSNDIRRLLGG